MRIYSDRTRIVLFIIIVFSLCSCLHKTYAGPSRGAGKVATLIVDAGQADRIELKVNEEKIDGPPFRISVLPGQTSIQVIYHVQSNSSDKQVKRFGECNLNFTSIAAQLYEVRFGLLTAGSAERASEATINARQLNTLPTSLYGTFDKKALATCRDLGVE